MKTVNIQAKQFNSAHEAIQWSEASGDVAVMLPVVGAPKHAAFVVDQEILDELAAKGVEFAYLFDHHGQIMTVPVN